MVAGQTGQLENVRQVVMVEIKPKSEVAIILCHLVEEVIALVKQWKLKSVMKSLVSVRMWAGDFCSTCYVASSIILLCKSLFMC